MMRMFVLLRRNKQEKPLARCERDLGNTEFRPLLAKSSETKEDRKRSKGKIKQAKMQRIETRGRRRER